MPTRPHFSRAYPSRQRGVSLLFALLTLTALLLATLALVRSVDSGNMILGNIGFKNDATAATDQATRAAISWLKSNGAILNADNATAGYYSTNHEYASDGVTLLGQLDVTGQQSPTATNRQLVDWDGNSCASAPGGSFGSCAITSASAGTINGNAARYVVFRLCSKTGDYSTDSSIICSTPVKSVGGIIERGELNYASSTRLGGATAPYYRIVVRVTGARNTVSFTETIIHF